jgi:hypothetical protein
MPGSHLKIMFLLVDMCNDWGFTTESYGSLSEVFNLNKDNLRKRINTYQTRYAEDRKLQRQERFDG